jgi:hypothetical protein
MLALAYKIPSSPSWSYGNEAELDPVGNGAALGNFPLPGTTTVTACVGMSY